MKQLSRVKHFCRSLLKARWIAALMMPFDCNSRRRWNDGSGRAYAGRGCLFLRAWQGTVGRCSYGSRTCLSGTRVEARTKWTPSADNKAGAKTWELHS